MRLCGSVKRQCLKVAKFLMLSVSTTTREMKNGCTAAKIGLNKDLLIHKAGNVRDKCVL